MNLIINTLMKLGIHKHDLDYHFIRASMVIIFLFFGYQKWFEYEAQALIPYISHGPLGALGSCFSFIATITIIPFIPNGWAPSAGGFPAMTETVAFLLKDLVLLAVSVYLLRQDVIRVSVVSTRFSQPVSAPFQRGTSSLEVTRGQ